MCHPDDIIASKAATNRVEGPRIAAAAAVVPRLLGRSAVLIALPLPAAQDARRDWQSVTA